MQHYMVANILPVDTPSTPGVGSKGQNIFFFLKASYVANQNKGSMGFLFV